VELKMISNKLQPASREFRRVSEENGAERSGLNIISRPLTTEIGIWLPASDIGTRRIGNRLHRRLPVSQPPRSGVKLAGQALVCDAWEIIRHSGLNLDGSILEFDTGLRPIGACFADYVAVDNDAQNVMKLRRKGIKAIRGTIEGLPFPAKSFDYVLAFSPLIIRDASDWKWVDENTNEVEVLPDYKKLIVGRAIQIARKKVLIASLPIAVDPPFVENAELVVTDSRNHFHYVVYKAN
jgi:hypothetical protein